MLYSVMLLITLKQSELPYRDCTKLRTAMLIIITSRADKTLILVTMVHLRILWSIQISACTLYTHEYTEIYTK